MSPGPSLALVVTNSIGRGRKHGVVTGLGHGMGIFLWAFLTASGIARIIVETGILLTVVQLLGACYLIYLGVRTLIENTNLPLKQTNASSISSKIISRSAGEGFLISILNPKIALFFLAIFSHFVQPNAGWVETGLMGITAGLIDASWYSVVALTMTKSGIIPFLQIRENTLHRIIGIFFIFIAVYLLIMLIRNFL
jgi:threonine/homoserine/homoserine lactone efflux protein